ncbi:hypothetical protein LOD99_10192 [Oopsacas minuta]|uniref:G-protein coupled receptors family 1 profile domain-containing protein n=1 Tax=Oopsacas minuta TaxID=111878 RepID=A0AAV7KIQ9_9METZ|nr:hypothetical protein LOD99_10192 [Oopsacas minuta]
MNSSLKINSEYIFWCIHIPLLIVISLVLLYICEKIRLISRENKQLSDLHISRDEKLLHRKNLKITLYTTYILLLILIIEFLPNLLAIISKLTTLQFVNTTTEYHFPISNSCIIISAPQLAAYKLPNSFLIFIAYKLSISFHLLLIPALCFMLKFLYRAYLCHNYDPVMKHWSCYLLVRFTASMLMINFFTLYWLFLGIEMFVYLTDYCIYLVYAYRFYLVLVSRREEALYHYGLSEHYQRISILKRYSATIVIITIPITLLVIQVMIENMMNILNLVLINSCYFNHITYGLTIVLRLPANTVETLLSIEGDVDYIWLYISIIRKSIVILLYLALLLVNPIQRLVRCRRIKARVLLVPLLTRNTC